MFRGVIITLSDSGFQKKREDLSGVAIKEMMIEHGYQVSDMILLPDDQQLLEQKLIEICDHHQADVIFTTGGTGFSLRDVTPEATKNVIEKETPGISEAMRYYSMQITPRAMLSRGVSGIRKQTLIVNLPGSVKAVKENLSVIIEPIKHGLDVLNGNVQNCGG